MLIKLSGKKWERFFFLVIRKKKEPFPFLTDHTLILALLSFLNTAIVAVVIAPIAAVWIGQILQDKHERRKDKLELFKTLMVSRNGWTVESVRALNVLDVVFSDDEKVRAAWKKYYDKFCVENPTDTELKKVQDAQYELLEAMAESLGYKETITWKTIQKPYKPKGMIEAEENQRFYQEGLLALAQVALNMKNMQSQSMSVSQQKEDKE